MKFGPTRQLIVAGLLAMFAGAQPAQAITVAGITFDDNAFADVLLSSFSTNDGDPVQGFIFGGIGGPGVINNAASLEAAVVGSILADAAVSFDSFSFIELGFTDNRVVNGPGADLAFFEIGSPDASPIAVALAPSMNPADFRVYDVVATGFQLSTQFQAINVAYVDLSDFGFAQGATLDAITVGLYPRIVVPGNPEGLPPDFTAAGALNSTAVPEPATMVLLSSALGGALLRRRRNQLG